MKKLFLIILLFLFVQCNTQKYVVQEPKYTSIMLFDMDGKILAVGSNELKLKNNFLLEIIFYVSKQMINVILNN